MRQPGRISASSLWLPACAFGVLCWCVLFEFPWIFPPRVPVASPSFNYGYNNSVAILGFAALLGVVLLWTLRRQHDSSRSLGSLPGSLFSGAGSSCGGKSAAATVGILTCLGVWSWWRYIPAGYFGETQYFLSRLDRMFVGQSPYRDFDFGYGPAMLYVPFWLHQITNPFLCLDTAYIVALLGFWVLGYYLFYRVLCYLNVSAGFRTAAILFLGLAGFNITLGVIYTPLRFIWATHAVLAVHRLTGKANDAASILRAGLAVLFFCLIGFAIAPDTGMTTLLALVVYLVWSTACVWKAHGWLLLAPLASALAVVGFFGTYYFNMLFAFGGGTMNFPIPPAPYIILLATSALWVIPRLAAGALAGEVRLRPLLAGITVCLGLGLPIAMGRCDPGHVFFNALPLFLVAAAALWMSGYELCRISAVVAVLLMAATVHLSFWGHYQRLVIEQISFRKFLNTANKSNADIRGLGKSLEKTSGFHAFPWAKPFYPNVPDIAQLLKYPRIATPLGAMEDMDKYLKVTGRHVPSYFVAPFDAAFTPGEINRKLASLEESPVLLIMRDSLYCMCPIDRNVLKEISNDQLSRLFVFPVRWEIANTPFSTEKVFVSKILLDYNKKRDFYNYLLMERKTPGVSLPLSNP